MNADSAAQAEKEILQKAGQQLSGGLIDEFVKQGHHLTGGWEKSLHSTVLGTTNAVNLIGTAASYGNILNDGVNPSRIPYGGESTGGKTSKYIEGLKAFWMLKGLSEKEATSAAFATAKHQKAEGMPTVGSYRFTQTGQRLRFIKIVDDKLIPEVNKTILGGINQIIDALFNEIKSETV